jgi:proteasome lid subunit RPN8/RPN11
MKNIKQLIAVDCEKTPNSEVCGFIIFKDNEFDIIHCENRSTDPENEFYIPAKDFLHIKRQNEVAGIYHSHAKGNCQPSEFDIKTCDLVCYPFVIYSIEKNNFHVLKPKHSDANENLVKKMEKLLND